ncbi:uncharacterized protein LOC116426415 [Nomia melanderi]|uniref:uncharacterized protein LOC116426415 n=1 Tax=Nomia melanderi TaxID=2448451 RepID=UPI0013045A99|nr:uncharacterized protein LOC116426415 [Nomia melanderi]
MDSNVCKICGTCAMKLIFCVSCNTNAHPDCLLTTGHPFVNGRFLDCSCHSRPFKDSREDILIQQFDDMLHFEFDKFEERITEAWKADMEKIQFEINKIANIVAALDLKVARFDRSLVTNSTSHVDTEETTVSRNIQPATGARYRYHCTTSGIKDQGTPELKTVKDEWSMV